MKKKLTSLFAAVAATAVLAACGGGGGSSPTPAPIANTPAPAPTPSQPAATNPDLVTSVTTPTYLAGTVERGAWTTLMAERQACGFGLVQQDTRLDAASTAHSKYLTDLSVAQKIAWGGHGEDSTKSGYSGGNGLDRAVFQGFPSSASASVDEILSADSVLHATALGDQLSVSEALGSGSMRRLMATVYHLSGALYAGRLGGAGAAHASTAWNASNTFEVYRFGSLIATTDNNPQRLGNGVIATYPCAAATHASSTFRPATESPNPFVDVTDTAVTYGTPIYLKIDATSVLVVNTATIIRASDGSSVTTRQVTKATDAAGELGANEFFMVPTSPLIAGAAYSVSVTGTADGVAFSKNFTFTSNN